MDSVGSNLALMHMLKAHGTDVTIYSQDSVPPECSFLPGSQSIRICNMGAIHWEEYDIFWALDQASLSRMGQASLPGGFTIINIDHHATNTRFGTVNVVQSDAASTSSILFEIFKKSSLSLSESVAQCLMAGLVGDTGFFRFVHSPEVFTMAAAFMEKGADYTQITYNTLEHVTLKDLQFLSAILSKAIHDKSKRCVIIAISHEMWQAYGKSDSGRALAVGYLSRIDKTDFGILLLEEQKGSVRVEFRARNERYNVAELALKLGGGGHASASGCRLQMSLKEAEKKILELIRKETIV